MKKILLVSLLMAAGIASAQDIATVIGVQPRFVTVYQRQCEVREVVRDNSRGDATVGAIAGGAIGSTLGHNSNDRLVGGIAGALIGGTIGSEVGRDGGRVEQREVCRNVPVQVQQGSVVQFNYHGQVFTQVFNQ